ncbi:formin-binding protein [Tilletia horrida]|uniref:Formin-binding protein n=1 Tax=Tilletia horrida TaxID=155126 RepID=A0AAN6G9W6_9BASI|nr:formin-binding protein [Tilletia horrida]
MPADHRRESSAGSARSAGAYGAGGGGGGGRPRDVGQQGDPAAFVNAFWGPNDAGFPTIQARMRTAIKTMDDLRALYKERAEIEAEYAKRLAKLSKSSSLGANESGAFRAALETVRFEIDATSRSHASLSNMLRKELDGQVAEFQAKFVGARKNSANSIEKLYKQKQTQEAYVNKSREKYEQDCIKINGYTAQSSLVQGRDLDKVSAKLDKAQATVGINDKDYQNFIKALKDTTIKWNGEWKVYLDQCQDLEEERLEFIKGNMWNYANGVSAICVADDESCERVRVALENCEPLRDIRFFIQKEATGPLIPDPPEYINYAKGQPPPSRPTGKQASFTRTSERPMQIFSAIAAAVAPVLPPTAPPAAVAAPVSPIAPLQTQDVQPNPLQQQQHHPPSQQQQQQQPPRGRSPPPTGGHGDVGVTLTDPGAQNGFRPPPGAVGLPGMTKQAGPSAGGPERRLSRQEFLSRAPSLSMKTGPPQAQGPPGADVQGSAPQSATAGDSEDDPLAKALASLRALQGQRAGGSTGMSPAMAAASLSNSGYSGAPSSAQQPPRPAAPPQPTAQELAAQRENEAAAATVASLPAKYQPPLLASPYATASPTASSTQLHDPHRRAPSPSPSMRSHASQHRPKSPSAVFMGAPPRSPSPLPQSSTAPAVAASGNGAGMTTSMSIEDVVGTYGQAFPGERKALSRQNSSASRAPSRAGSTYAGGSRPVSGQFHAQGSAGMAGVGARGRSPSPGPPVTGMGPGGYGRPPAQQQGPGGASHQYSHSQSSHAGRVASNATVMGAPAAGAAGGVPPRSTTPLGIMLDARGAVTHDQMAEEYMRRASSTAPGQVPHAQAQAQAHAQAHPQHHPQHAQHPQHPSAHSHMASAAQAPPPIQTQMGAGHYQPAAGQPPMSPYGAQPQQQQPGYGHPAQQQPQQYGYQAPPGAGAQPGYGQHPAQQASMASAYGAPAGGAPAPAHMQQHQHAAQASGYAPGMHGAQPSYATSQYGAVPPQSHTPAPGPGPQHAAYPSSQSMYSAAPGGYGATAPGGASGPGPSVSQSVPAHLAGGAGGAGAAGAGQTAASAYMQQYLQQQQQGQGQGQRPVSPAPSAHPAQQQQQQQQGAWAGHPGTTATPAPAAQVAPAPASGPGPAAATAAAGGGGGGAPVPPTAPAVSAPTGQYTDAGHPILFYVTALYDYAATQASEFSFTAGDIIAVTHTAADGWWSGQILDEARRKPGANTFPSNFVSLLS